MDSKKRIRVILFAIAALLFISALLLLFNNRCKSVSAYNAFAEIIDSRKESDISLKIYAMGPGLIFTPYPYNTSDLLRSSSVIELDVSGQELSNHLKQFEDLQKNAFKPELSRVYPNARVYYYFVVDDEKQFEVVFPTSKGGVLINNVAYKWNPLFEALILPFLPEGFLNP